MSHAVQTGLRRLGLKVFPRLEGLRRIGGMPVHRTVKALKNFDLLINGQLRPAGEGRVFESLNPSTGEPWARAADAQESDAAAAVAAARRAFDQGPWPGMTPAERGIYLKRAAKLIRDHAKELADIECADTGKTIKQTTFIDVPTCADSFDYFSEAGAMLQSEPVAVSAPVKSVLRRDPLGVVAAVIPWNYPLIMAAWKMAPALIAGNTLVFKPSATAAISVLRLAQILHEAGFPAGVVNVLSASRHAAVEPLLTSPDVDMVTFTGGTETGRAVMRAAAGTNKKVSLELGGKSPTMVFADCDFDAALGGAMSAIFMNQGQMCTAGSRLLLEDAVYDRFLAALEAKTRGLKIGPAHHYDTDFGPLVSAAQRETVLNYVQRGQAEGARLVCGGTVPEGADLQKGFYVRPAIFADVREEMAIVREEIFGPVLTVMRFQTEDEAVALANATPYGLAAGVWTKDAAKAERVAGQLRCGTVWINTYGGFYNETPFGGCKQSGFGRELGRDGLWEYTLTKHVCVDQTPGGRPLVASWF